jgi:hypothetical protein
MGPRSGPALIFCYAVIEKMPLNSTPSLLVLADLNSAPRKLQKVVRNYPPTDLKVAGDITTADSNYPFLGLELHAENGGASYVVGNHFTGNEPQTTQALQPTPLKTRIQRKTTNEQKLHNFYLRGGAQHRPTLSFCYAVIEKMSLNLPLRLLVLADSNSTP